MDTVKTRISKLEVIHTHKKMSNAHTKNHSTERLYYEREFKKYV